MRGKDCRFEILLFLHRKEELNFEEIIKKVKAARRTTNNYLRDLYNEKLVTQKYGRRAKYYLTEAGKTEAERQMHLHASKHNVFA